MRTSDIKRKTNETDIALSLCLDGKGVARVKSGCGFLDHMLTLFAKHSRFDLELECVGDTSVDYHHTTEDIGICLGRAFAQALGDKRGIKRYADVILPMDETLIMCAVDISGRAGLYCKLEIPAYRVGEFDTELCEEFFAAFVRESGITLHIDHLRGTNSHHIIEGTFKAVARVLGEAASIDARLGGEIPSTKGAL